MNTFTQTNLALALLLLNACATVDVQDSMQHTQAQLDASRFMSGTLSLHTTTVQKEAMTSKANALLQQPIDQNAAIELMLTNSPEFQSLLASHWGEATQAAQSGRLSNPLLSFERLRIQNEVEIGRLLSFGLLDLISLPARQEAAQLKIDHTRLRLSAEVVDQVTALRQAWVNALAAKQKLQYAEKVFENAEATAELARRMQEAGNFNRLDRARQHSFYADAAITLTQARHQAKATEEALGRMMGLDARQHGQLKLPERLPELPAAPKMPSALSEQVVNRLDVQLAKLQYDAALQTQGIGRVSSFTDLELGLRRDTVFENNGGPSIPKKGFELDIRLPLFDWGDLKREAMTANTLKAANQLEATLRAAGSGLREAYSAYRSAYDIARHYRDEIIPLKQIIADENLLRYNGMFIGVFELLADSRDQVQAVTQAIDAQAEFWRADAALQATLMGRPSTNSLTVGKPGGGQANTSSNPAH